MKPRIMYIEYKASGAAANGTARIGRVTFSDSGRTLYYRGSSFRSLKGGYKANYYEVETGEHYWISGCKRNGADRLYASAAQVSIDEDVREEYWVTIRRAPQHKARRSYRCV